MAAFAQPILAQPQPLALPKPLAETWAKEKHGLGWVGKKRDNGTIDFRYVTEEFEPGSAIPAFDLMYPTRLERLAKLPHPSQPFGIKLYLEKSDGPILAELKAFKHLTRIVTYGCPIDEDVLLKALAEMPQLEELQLNESKISNKGLEALARLKNLKKLGLRGTKITDAGIPALAAFEKLEHLELGVNLQITDKGAPAIAKLKSLRYLDLHLTRVLDEGMKSIATMDHLRGLYFMNTRSTAKGLKALGALKDLERFQIDGHAVNPDTVAAVVGMKKLKYLNLNIAHSDKTSAGDAEFKELGALKDIEELRVLGWQITDASLPVIRGFANLRFIDLTYTKIKRASAEQLQKELPRCRVFLP